VYDVVVKSPRLLSHLLMNFLFEKAQLVRMMTFEGFPRYDGYLNVATFKYSLPKFRETTLQWKYQLIYAWRHLLYTISRKFAINADCAYENLYSPSKHGRQQTMSNTNEIKQYSTDKTYSKLTSHLATRLAHNTLGKEKSKYSW